MLPRALAAALVLIGLAFAPAAHAVSVSILASGSALPDPVPGSTITLTVRVTTSDTPGILDNNILGRIVHDPAFVTPLGNAVQYALPGFASGSLAACTATDCEVMDQIAFPSAINPNVTDFVIAQVGYTVTFPFPIIGQQLPFYWKTFNPGRFDFFGLTSSPGAVIPEPTSAGLLGLGLLGLALAGRRKR